MSNTINKSKASVLITVASIAIPIVVALLFRVKIDVELPVFLPPIYATINAITALVLIAAVYFISKGNRILHEKLMKFAMILSLLFLVMYVAYHMTSDSTSYQGEGVMRLLYFIILISHITLSIAVIPLVLVTFLRGITGDFVRHKKIARITFPIWLYVVISGVIVYLMIAPYYS